MLTAFRGRITVEKDVAGGNQSRDRQFRTPVPSILQVTTMRRVALRIVPFLMVCYFVSFLDRVNVGFAALQMVKDLHMSPAVFGFGSGIFFVSYFLCEVPSNLILAEGRRAPLDCAHHDHLGSAGRAAWPW